MNRIKSLDGIRGIFIIIVLIAHALETIPAFITNNQLLSFFIINSGQLGVRIFFVISGYLITKLLLLEQEKTGRVNVKYFYLRRAFRIFPIFFTYIIVILLLKWSIVPDIFNNYSLVFFASFYLWNYKHFFMDESPEDHGNWFFGHFWSLSMEEQFYLLWPITFVKLKKPILIKGIIIIILLMPFLRIFTFLFIPGSKPYINAMLHTGGDSILIGCLAALIEKTHFFETFYTKFIKNKVFMTAVILFLFIISPLLTFYFQAPYNLLAGFSLNNLSIIIFVLWTIYIPSKIAWFLNTKVMIRIGFFSYSLYVWQQLFLTSKNSLWVNHFPQNLLVAVLIAILSYYIVEQPTLKLKERFNKV